MIYVLCLSIENELPMIEACRPNATYIFTILNATEISTPGFHTDRAYPGKLDCNWKIKGVQRKNIKLTINDNMEYEVEEK